MFIYHNSGAGKCILEETPFFEEIYADINVSNPLELAASSCKFLDPTFPTKYPDDPHQFEAFPPVQMIFKQVQEEVDFSDEHPPTTYRIKYLIAEAKKRIL